MSTMSSPINQPGVRSRVPRLAEGAIERARLVVAPAGSTQASRTPFAVLVVALLAVGVVGLLMFNTHMQQTAFTTTRLENQMADLKAREQTLTMELDALREPQHLAQRAKRIGMVPPAQPAFVRLSDGTVLGIPAPARVDDAVRINPMPAEKPAQLRVPPKIVRVPASSTTGGRASTTTPPARGRTGGSDHTTAQTPGATR